MTYKDIEASKDSGAPVECYEFIGVSRSWYYTSRELSVVLKGRLYSPAPIKRNRFKTQTGTESNSPLEVQVDNKVDIVQHYAFPYVPPRELSCTLYRFHDTGLNDQDENHVVLWTGTVASVKIEDLSTKFIIPNIFSTGLRQDLPSVWFQNSCNHMLFDQGCGLNAADYTKVSKVTKVEGVKIFVESTQGEENTLVAGILRVERSLETRLIVSNTDTEIMVSFPFNDIRVGDSVDMVLGCDHSHSTCLNKFNNSVNYGGFPSIPKDNPFEGDLF